MSSRDLNHTLSCLFTLVLLAMNKERASYLDDASEATGSLDVATLSTLRDYGLVQYVDEGDCVYLTAEGQREALGALKYLQLALGPSLGAAHDEVRDAWPRLFADQVAAGAGPLTMSEFVAAVSKGGRLRHDGTTFSPTVLPDPPAAYHRDPGNRRMLLLHLQLDLDECGSRGSYFGGFYGERYGRRGIAPCWRKVMVPAGLTFLDLHLVIQRCLCWTDQRPFGFLLTSRKDNLLIGERDLCGTIPVPKTRKKKFVETRASLLRLGDVFPRTHEATYSYGEDMPWEVAVRVLETHEGAASMGPQLIDGVGDAPPEWVVSEDGFTSFEHELYSSSRNVIRAVSEAVVKGFFPFEIGVARERLAGFERDRERWQARIDEHDEKYVPTAPADDGYDDLSRFDGYEDCYCDDDVDDIPM